METNQRRARFCGANEVAKWHAVRRPIAMPAPTCTRSTRNARVQAHLLLFATTALVLMAALSSAALAQPAVTVIPKSGPPTDRVTVSGTGFGADEAVDIYFDTTDLALAATNPSGSFTGIRLTIPASAVPGAHWITGVGRTSGLAAQTTFIVQTDWSQFRRGPQHHGYNPTENILNVSNVGDMQVRWTATTRGAVESSPAVANGVVYVGSGDDKVYAFNTATGQLIWSAFRDAVAAVGITGRLVPHQNRHTYATEMLRSGVGLPALMQLLGPAPPEV